MQALVKIDSFFAGFSIVAASLEVLSLAARYQDAGYVLDRSGMKQQERLHLALDIEDKSPTWALRLRS